MLFKYHWPMLPLQRESRTRIPEPSALSFHSIQDTPHTALLSQLYALTANLPQSIPIGSQNEPFGCFAVNSQDLILPWAKCLGECH